MLSCSCVALPGAATLMACSQLSLKTVTLPSRSCSDWKHGSFSWSTYCCDVFSCVCMWWFHCLKWPPNVVLKHCWASLSARRLWWTLRRKYMLHKHHSGMHDSAVALRSTLMNQQCIFSEIPLFNWSILDLQSKVSLNRHVCKTSLGTVRLTKTWPEARRNLIPLPGEPWSNICYHGVWLLCRELTLIQSTTDPWTTGLSGMGPLKRRFYQQWITVGLCQLVV